MQNHLLTIPTTCKLLQVGRSTIYALVARGHLRPVKVGAATRFASSDIDAFIEQLREQAAKAAEGRATQ
ncbi:MAG: hypothetical protein B7Y80_20130 [Hyphomicrobium sp. 32-62-53]|nr:MAG: hypothetical protein B7Z29_19960 [Hyphomicrobium sp. 12-62-95]OYX97342.1 MAG: hypothetical protein B7Y80_20130 [Hyphomicrobium sp. 32-62-53]